jgi:2'-5' RNA ligase
MADKKRIFVAIDLPGYLKEELAALKVVIKQEALRYTRTESLHITLHFIGDTPVENITRIEEVLSKIKSSGPFNLQFKEVKPVKKRGKLSMLWLVFEESSAFINLAHQVAEAITGKPADRPVAHITLARAKEGKPVTVDESTLPHVNNLELEVSSFGLWLSILGPGGSVYKLIRDFKL